MRSRTVRQLKAGETLLVLGAAGGVGLTAVEIGKIMGARVIAAASSEAKLALCRAHGADALINYATSELRERLRGDSPPVRAWTSSTDPVGGSYAEPAVRSLAFLGRYLVIGFASGEIPKIPLNLLLAQAGPHWSGVFWGAYAPPRAPAAQRAEFCRTLCLVCRRVACARTSPRPSRSSATARRWTPSSAGAPRARSRCSSLN